MITLRVAIVLSVSRFVMCAAMPVIGVSVCVCASLVRCVCSCFLRVSKRALESMTVVSTEKETHGDGERGKKQETESDARMRRKGRRAYSEEGGGVAYNDDDDYYGCERDNDDDDDARLLLLAASHASSSSPPSPSSPSSSSTSSSSSSSPAVCAMALVVGYMLKQRLVPLLMDALQEQKRFVCVTVRQHRLF